MKDRQQIEQPVAIEFKRFNDEFATSLESSTGSLQSAIEHILHSTGKHIRPLLVLLTAKACGGVTENTINSAVLLELLHTATSNGADFLRSMPYLIIGWLFWWAILCFRLR